MKKSKHPTPITPTCVDIAALATKHGLIRAFRGRISKERIEKTATKIHTGAMMVRFDLGELGELHWNAKLARGKDGGEIVLRFQFRVPISTIGGKLNTFGRAFGHALRREAFPNGRPSNVQVFFLNHTLTT